MPGVAIFDGVFVADNIHSGEVVDITHKRNLYRVIIGEVGATLAREDDQLAAESRAKTGEITSLSKALKPHIPTEITQEQFIALPKVDEIDDDIAQQERVLDAANQADVIRGRQVLSELKIPSAMDNLGDLLGRAIDDIAKDTEQLVAEHLAAHKMEREDHWIAARVDGLDETCPFCGQKLEGLPLIAAFRTVFGSQYKKLAAEIKEANAVTARAFSEGGLADIELADMRNRSAAEFWSKHCSLPDLATTLPPGMVDIVREMGTATLALLARKAASPLETVALDSRYIEALGHFADVEEVVAEINDAIRATNDVIATKKAETEVLDVEAEKLTLVCLKAAKARHLEPVARLCDELDEAAKRKHEIDDRKAAVRADLDAHTQCVVQPYQTRINDFLDAFNAGFRIAETKHTFPGGYASSSYRLVINGTVIEVGDSRTPPSEPSFKNTLSSGDRATLALAFFLASLERDAAIGTKIVVFDDPFNSQDAFRRRQTIHEIMKVASACEQVIVLSHDTTFLKQLWDKAPVNARVSLAITDHRASGSKLLPIDLDKACQGRTATDVDDLQTYMTGGAGAPLDVIRKMRVVLETYCRTTYPQAFGASDWLGDMVGKIRAEGPSHPAYALYEELDQINDYSKEYHHGEDIADATPDQIDSTELNGYVRRCLRIVNALQA